MFTNTPAYQGVPVEIEGVRQNVIVFGLMVDAVVASASDTTYRVPQAAAGRLDLISEKFYGTTELWWVLALVNNLSDPLVGAAVGQTIRIPTRDRMAAEGVLNV
jgi:nucleoid-associated protein YgaU